MSDKKKALKRIDSYAHDLGYQFTGEEIIWALEEVMVSRKKERAAGEEAPLADEKPHAWRAAIASEKRHHKFRGLSMPNTDWTDGFNRGFDVGWDAAVQAFGDALERSTRETPDER